MKRQAKPCESSFYCYAVLVKYIAAVNCGQKEFSDVEHLFDALYHKNYTLVSKDGETLPRDEIKRRHSDYIRKGGKFTLVNFTSIGLYCVDVEIRFATAEESKSVHAIVSLEDNKFVKAQVVDSLVSILKARIARPGMVRMRSERKFRPFHGIKKKLLSNDRAMLVTQRRRVHADTVISSQNACTADELSRISMESSKQARKVAQELADGYGSRSLGTQYDDK
ncbi:hypothetical protein ACHAWF_016901 [Thalassiosira exigua]